ncbi:gas vesicle protein GvpG [Leptolyngbya sp. FACHB-671]|uniref:gas vesicle protein GvpG n=1 Tax=Leptolyngbya sp. FACHB-671 TaxID=2692812 RepID=UPI00168A10DC|nr:gas vesicle protein GvpG [Leptolyngbya sp. FACHB-671]MBD1870149.1 gas vesicle protein GvpG [Cyanobacteria bacterium FACHB-471]MBD2071091.1 gas vesicle protein GvpG [Leptolyngbya sp. FACHB-671]
MFLDLLLTPITAPISGIAWVGNKVLEQANAALDDKENLSKQLLSLQLAFDMGEVPEEEFEIQEEELLLAIQALEDEARAAEQELE